MFEIICAEEDDGDIFPEWGVNQKSPRKDFHGLTGIRTFVRELIIPSAAPPVSNVGGDNLK